MERNRAAPCEKAAFRMELKKKLKGMTGAGIFLLAVIFLSPTSFAAEMLSLVPGGEVVGIDIRANGVIVTELTEVETASGTAAPAKDAGIMPGDVIVRIGGTEITCGDDLRRALDAVSGETTVRIARAGELKQLNITPCTSCDGVKTIGVWVRDGIAGIGTITFYDPQSGAYGALGHEISDVDTNILFPLETGNIMPAELTDTVRATGSEPGQLRGEFGDSDAVGDVRSNTDAGIFGNLSDTSILGGTEAIPVADASDVHSGEAVILSTVDGGGVDEYTVKITRVSMGRDHGTRNLMFSVTDERLIEKTGGVVQGMSGSPIIQDGKLIGAVTHVLMKDSSKGYGIFIGNMLDSLDNAA